MKHLTHSYPSHFSFPYLRWIHNSWKKESISKNGLKRKKGEEQRGGDILIVIFAKNRKMMKKFERLLFHLFFIQLLDKLTSQIIVSRFFSTLQSTPL